MFGSGKELLATCQNQRIKISQAMIQREQHLFESCPDQLRNQMLQQWRVMETSVESALNQSLTSMGGLIGGEAKKLMKRQQAGKAICGDITAKAVAYSMGVLEVNASMGVIVAAPTAGSSGILPGTLKALQEEHSWEDTHMVDALFCASAIGLIITEKATVAGAEGGCQAETGSAAAMTAAAICELMGASPEVSLHAAAICLKNVMGQVCDPIAGLVEAPCQKRNGIGAANALISAEIALAGVPSLIPFDEVVEAMGHVGRSLPESLRETALGGVAATPTGCALKEKLRQKK
ncbi:L-serine ammonia-lyase, iron-sulfur-dependent, subunit alpha [Tindallia californiensis]|uniref:L-serine dehydratase n=1 Tax=Tindallia californiensis TaxID=159292 RepID=A0A1H3MB59_9FIRM|nr:L-serine ammonia-lyase, iron-sulfur-dependent, subunit alpha [Tindallia californiensis]SDY73931.1 L-serine dehydratase [Tindallia californiensis]